MFSYCTVILSKVPATRQASCETGPNKYFHKQVKVQRKRQLYSTKACGVAKSGVDPLHAMRASSFNITLSIRNPQFMLL
jgi:hypothetical protein